MPRAADHQPVIDLLNDILTAELTAINQYFMHAKILDNWGFKLLAGKVKHESIDEMKHADELMERILYLGGLPNLQRLDKLHIGETVREMFTSDMAMENLAIDRFNKGISYCREHGDNGTRVLLDEMLVSEEEHLDWLETQLDLMDRIGDNPYLAEHIHE